MTQDTRLQEFKDDVARDAEIGEDHRDAANEDMRFINVPGGMWENFLEDELLNATTTGYTGARSPNRMDAFVFAMTELFPAITREKKETGPISVPKLRRLKR